MRGPAKLARALHRLAAAHPPAHPGRADCAPTDCAPAGRTSSDRAPWEHAPWDHAPEDRAPTDCAPAGHAPSDHVPSDHVPSDHVPWDHAPEDRAPAGRGPAGPAPGSASASGRAFVPAPPPTPAGRRDADACAMARLVRSAAATLPAWARGEAPQPPGGVLCHGDLHLGQLVRGPAGRWRLIDVDDLGLGTPSWDLARPAAWYAAGLLDTETWLRFLDAYRAAGGPAAGAPGTDPWPELDLAARALTVQTAALALAKAAREDRRLDDVERLMVDACARIASLPPDLEPSAPS
ncbi:aminoglycoside phosphotransferase family protein [Streptomyces sp. NPDC054956]